VTKIVGRTHPGARGGENEDAMGWDEAKEFAFVADGMGGYAGGEVASGLVKETLLASVGLTDLDTGLMKAHARVVAAVEDHPELTGMGSTVVAIQIADRHCHVAWVGDSRGYLWRKGKLRPITRDHSVLEVLRETENLSEAELRNHPLRNRVMQSLGVEQPVPSAQDVPLRRGDWILLCSDGLHGELLDEEMSTLLAANPTLDGAADALINDALAKGGRDNVTVVLVEYTGLSSIEFFGLRNERAVIWLSAIGGALLAIAVAVIAFWLRSGN
jgi:protein phosphatase